MTPAMPCLPGDALLDDDEWALDWPETEILETEGEETDDERIARTD